MDMVRQVDTIAHAGSNARVLCASSSNTTRLVVDMTEMRLASPLQVAKGFSRGAISPVSAKATFGLTSVLSGSIISSSHSSIHFRVSPAIGASPSETIDAAGTNLQLADTQVGDDAFVQALRVKISLDGVQSTTTSLQRASTGVLLSLDGREGTHVFDISLLAEETDECKARTELSLEMFSAETHIVRRRSSHGGVVPPSSMAGEAIPGGNTFDMTRVVFLIDLEIVDGYKLSTLHLMKHLPTHFEASTLDLSCTCEFVLSV